MSVVTFTSIQLGAKPKVRSSTKSAKKTKKKEAKTQSERFIKAAREIGVDETGKEFEKLFRQTLRLRD